MTVNLDGRPLDEEITTEATLQALIDRVRAVHLPDRVVVAVHVNDQAFVGAELVERLSQPIAADDRIALESADARAISASALRDAAVQIGQTGAAQTEIADQLNGGQVADAINRVGDSVESWQMIQSVVLQCCGLLGDDLTEYTYEERSVRAHFDDLADKLRELRGAFEARDMVLLADLLHYEMPPLCESWHNLLTHLAETVAHDVSAASKTGSS